PSSLGKSMSCKERIHYEEVWKRPLTSMDSSTPRPIICWWTFAPASTDKTPCLGCPAAQAAHLDGFGAAMEEAANAGQKACAGSCLGAEAAPAYICDRPLLLPKL